MAEYFPLLDRAISSLTEPTAEARRSIYDRARTALIGQLRRMEPPVPEDDIARENAALDDAVARIEARFADRGRAGSVPSAHPEPAARPEPAAVAAASPLPAAPAAARVPPIRPPAGIPPLVPPPSRERPVLGPRAAPGVAPAVAAPRPNAIPARTALPPRGTRPVMAIRPGTPTSDRAAAEPGAASASAAPGVPSPAQAPAGELGAADREGAGQEGSFAEAMDAASRVDPHDVAVVAEAPRIRESASHPPAPRARETRGWRRPALAAACAVGALAVAGIGVAAYRLRDRPEQVVSGRAVPSGEAEAPQQGKVAERAAPAASDGTADAASEPSTSGAAVPVPVPVPQGSGSASSGPAIAVAQRAALLVDAPDDPQRVRTYVGSVVWHLDSVNPGGGQPLASAVKADIDIPEAKLKVTMLMQRNPEPQLPASHTVEFHFLPQSGNVLGPVKQINVPEMRRDDDAPTGDAMTGVPVAITDNYFLVGLSRGAAETQNVRLLTERNWFDMSVLFTSGKLGKLTFEKGTAGQRVIDDALKGWK